jgi:hypothetical protein
MSDSIVPTTHDAGIEQLLAALAGVVSARVISGADGEIEEIHILASPSLHPKQVVRNVESALRAGLGIEIDRRIVSVAQIRPDALDSGALRAADPATAPVAHTVAAGMAGEAADRPGDVAAAPRADHTPAPAARPALAGFDTRVDALRMATCRVTLRWGPDEFTGEGSGPDTPQGRADAAARAVFAAAAAFRGTDRLVLEGTALVEADGRAYVIVAARSIGGRRPVALTGAARVEHSPEEAGILAALQATNHWRAPTR